MSTPGTLLNRRYRLVSVIAVGGMGDVWRADDELLGREVAVKVLRAEHASDETFRARFHAEARNTAALSHPGIAQVFDYGEQDDIAYLVMELVPGEPLSAVLARDGRLGAERTLEIVAQTGDALRFAHDAGIIHRDVKPANLMILPSGRVKVTDFGIARGMDTSATLTQTGMVLGTARYVSPEQAEGATLTPATDVYSLGVVAYECLAGAPPFVGDTALSIALAHVRDEPPPLPDDVPPAVRALVVGCLAKDPSARPAGAGALAARAHAMAAALAAGETIELVEDDAGEGTVDDATSPSGDTGGAALSPRSGDTGDLGAVAPRRRRAVMAAGIAGVLVVLVGSLVLAFRWYDVFSMSGQTAGDGGPAPTRVSVTSPAPSPVDSFPVADTTSHRPRTNDDEGGPAPVASPSRSKPPKEDRDRSPGTSPTPTPTPSAETPDPTPTPTPSETPSPTPTSSPSSTPPTTPPDSVNGGGTTTDSPRRAQR